VVEKRKRFWECLPIIVKLFWLKTKFIILPSCIYIYILKEMNLCLDATYWPAPNIISVIFKIHERYVVVGMSCQLICFGFPKLVGK
jgi:hypothetical protein